MSPRQKAVTKPLTLPDRLFFALLDQERLPHPHREFKFSDDRGWRADYCWPQQLLILEVEGGVWTQGRHTRGKGFLLDLEKYNAAAVLGYRLLRVTPSTLHTNDTIVMIRACLSCASPLTDTP